MDDLSFYLSPVWAALSVAFCIFVWIELQEQREKQKRHVDETRTSYFLHRCASECEEESFRVEMRKKHVETKRDVACYIDSVRRLHSPRET